MIKLTPGPGGIMYLDAPSRADEAVGRLPGARQVNGVGWVVPGDTWSLEQLGALLATEFPTEITEPCEEVIESNGLPPAFKHQEVATQDILKNWKNFGGHILAMEMGTGKTRSAIDAMQEVRPWRVLVLAPLSVVGNWGAELKWWTDEESRPRFFHVGGKSKGLRSKLVSQWAAHDGPALLGMNYESARTVVDLISAGLQSGRRPAGAPSVCILDESHRIKSPSAARSKAARFLSGYCSRVLLLTGTPFPNGLIDGFNQVRTADANAWSGETFQAWKRRHLVMGGFENHKIVGYRDKDRIIEVFHDISTRVKKEDCLDLPPKIYSVIEVEMAGAQARAYKDLKEDCQAWLEDQDGVDIRIVVRQALAKMLRLAQVAGGYTNIEDRAIQVVPPDRNPKLLASRDILLDGGGSTVIWTRFRAEAEALTEMARKIGKRPALIHGGVAGSKRDDIIARFQSGELDVLCATAASCGIGVNLTAASREVFYSNGFELDVRLQAEDRLHRPGQNGSHVEIIDLVAKGTVDPYILQAIRAKENIAEEVLRAIRKV